MRKYWEIFKFNLKVKANFKTNFFFTLFSFTLHMLIFGVLWDYILKDKSILGYTKESLIWYIIIGEIIVYSGSRNFRKISEMIKNGDIANLLIKPVSIVKYFFVEEASSIVYLGLNMFFGFILGYLMTGFLKISIIQIVLFVLSILISLTLFSFFQVFIGLLSFFTEDNDAFYLMISKSILIVILTPVEFFPELFQKVLMFLPTTYVAYAPAKIFSQYGFKEACYLIFGQIISLIFILGITYVINMKGVEKINVNGG